MSSTMAMSITRNKPSYPDEQWADLIRKMAGGNQAALGELYDQSSRLVSDHFEHSFQFGPILFYECIGDHDHEGGP